MTKLGADQGIMRKVQGGCVGWLIGLLGVRWQSSLFSGQVGPIVLYIVVQGGLAGIDSEEKYMECKAASVKGNFHLLQQIQQAQNMTVKQHHDKV
jgi:hypothetical protein